MKKRVFVAVDGSNLYHRLKEERVAPSHAMIEHATETRLLRKDDLTPFVVEKTKKRRRR